MKEGWSGIYETEESKQARADWCAFAGRPFPVEYRDTPRMTMSYALVRLAVVAVVVLYALYAANR
jgi:hypothetical protein